MTYTVSKLAQTFIHIVNIISNSMLLLLLTLCMALLPTVYSECYFPVEMQGEFMTQWKEAPEIAYTSISLTYNSIPAWGVCHQRHRENVILRDDSRVTRRRDARHNDNQEKDVEHNDVVAEDEGAPCFRCIRMIQRSANVNQVHTRRNLNSRAHCWPSAAEALADCPTESEVRHRQVEEIMLYKTRGFYGESAVTQTHCPFSGRWGFSYNSNNNIDDASSTSCNSPASEAGGCPTEFMLDLKFRGCTDFPDLDMSFQCLGDWMGEDGRRYLSLLDTKLPQLGEAARPRYRCAVYDSDRRSGVTHLALSNDSTCVNQLESHLVGYETLRLERKQQHTEPSDEIVEEEETMVEYPMWSQGNWEDQVEVHSNELIYRNAQQLTTYYAKAIKQGGDSDDNSNSRRYIASLSTACGDLLGYACIALERRTANIMELKIGKIDSRPDDSQLLCSADYLDPMPWATLGRLAERVACPLTGGAYHGIIPDAEGGLCARSATATCRGRPDQMAYQVYNCANASEVYEDRVYQCYGQFEDTAARDGLVYTFTRRLDVPRQECFVGTTSQEGEEHYVLEAGAHCARGKQPVMHGMIMRKEEGQQGCTTDENIQQHSPNVQTENNVEMKVMDLQPQPHNNRPVHHLQQHNHHNNRPVSPRLAPTAHRTPTTAITQQQSVNSHNNRRRPHRPHNNKHNIQQEMSTRPPRLSRPRESPAPKDTDLPLFSCGSSNNNRHLVYSIVVLFLTTTLRLF